jgi:hypothetical protein
MVRLTSLTGKFVEANPRLQAQVYRSQGFLPTIKTRNYLLLLILRAGFGHAETLHQAVFKHTTRPIMGQPLATLKLDNSTIVTPAC